MLIIFGCLASLVLAKDYNVFKYGAKGDGVTLDTEAIKATIAAAMANGGGRVSGQWIYI
jgi:polygalacturonase